MNNNEEGDITFGFKPDYRLDSTGLASLITLMGQTVSDVETGPYIIDFENKPYFSVNIRKVDWNGDVVDYDFPQMGSAISDKDFRWSCNVAYTIEINSGESFNAKSIFTPPTTNEVIQVAWGDSENIETFNLSGDISHTYEQGGTYTIFIKGNLIKRSTNGAGAPAQLKGIHFIKPTSFYSTSRLFAIMPNLTDVMGTIKPEVGAVSFKHMFFKTPNITNIKGFKILLPHINVNSENAVNSLQHVFGTECQLDSSKKAQLIKDFNIVNHNRHAITSIDTAFIGSDLDVFPLHLFGKNVTNGYCAFENCPKINYVPAHRFENLETAYKMFSTSGATWPSGCPMSLSPEIKFPKLKNGEGMFMNRLLSFDDIKRVFESLPKNPNPPSTRGKTGFTALDNINPDEYRITFSFDIKEPHIKEKLIKYFRLNSNAAIKFHKTQLTGWQGGNVIDINKEWDGGWYPVYWTDYGDSWDYNNSKGWFVSFHNPNNYPGK